MNAKVVNIRARAGAAVILANPDLLDLPGFVEARVGTYDVSFQYDDLESARAAEFALAEHWSTGPLSDESYLSRSAVHDGVTVRVVWTAAGGDPS